MFRCQRALIAGNSRLQCVEVGSILIQHDPFTVQRDVVQSPPVFLPKDRGSGLSVSPQFPARHPAPAENRSDDAKRDAVAVKKSAPCCVCHRLPVQAYRQIGVCGDRLQRHGRYAISRRSTRNTFCECRWQACTPLDYRRRHITFRRDFQNAAILSIRVGGSQTTALLAGTRCSLKGHGRWYFIRHCDNSVHSMFFYLMFDQECLHRCKALCTKARFILDVRRLLKRA